MQTQDNTKMCYWRGNQSTQHKNLFVALQTEIDPLVNKLEYKIIKKTLQA